MLMPFEGVNAKRIAPPGLKPWRGFGSGCGAERFKKGRAGLPGEITALPDVG